MRAIFDDSVVPYLKPANGQFMQTRKGRDLLAPHSGKLIFHVY